MEGLKTTNSDGQFGRPIRTADSGRPTRAAKVAHGGHKVPTGGLTNGGCEKDFLKNLLTNPLNHPLENPLNDFLKNPLKDRLKNPLNGGLKRTNSGRPLRAGNSRGQLGRPIRGGQHGRPIWMINWDGQLG